MSHSLSKILIIIIVFITVTIYIYIYIFDVKNITTNYNLVKYVMIYCNNTIIIIQYLLQISGSVQYHNIIIYYYYYHKIVWKVILFQYFWFWVDNIQHRLFKNCFTIVSNTFRVCNLYFFLYFFKKLIFIVFIVITVNKFSRVSSNIPFRFIYI